MSESNDALPPAALYFTFPPFPDATGKDLIPFTAFKPKGILAVDPSSDEVEVDGEGIATLTLGVHHTTGKEEGAKKKRKKKKTHLNKDGPVVVIPWWQEWEEAEGSRPSVYYDPTHDRGSRFHQLSQEFLGSRKFTPSIQSLWDHFRFFVGLISKPINQHPLQKKGLPGDELDPGNISDEDEDLYAEFQHAADDEEIDEDVPTTQSLIGGRQVFPHEEDELQEGRMNNFLDNTEQSVKIFLSSYSYDRGFQLSYAKSRDAPILVAYVLRYILRHNAFPEYESRLKDALATAEKAQIELLYTRKISSAIPDAWSRACLALWGSMELKHAMLPALNWTPSGETPDVKSLEIKEKSDEVDFEEELKRADVRNFVTEADFAKDAMGDGLDSVTSNQLSTWGSNPAQQLGWGTAAPTDNVEVGEWGANTDLGQDWAVPPSKDGMLQIVGPTSVPLTHKPVRAEQSTRRIISFSPPSDEASSILERRLAQIVLAPWPAPKPDTSVPPPLMLFDETEGVIGEHDLHNTDISIFVEALVLDSLFVGLGLTGVWVQTVEKDDENVSETEDVKLGTEKESADKKAWWYAESVRSVIPSYWLDA